MPTTILQNLKIRLHLYVEEIKKGKSYWEVN